MYDLLIIWSQRNYIYNLYIVPIVLNVSTENYFKPFLIKKCIEDRICKSHYQTENKHVQQYSYWEQDILFLFSKLFPLNKVEWRIIYSVSWTFDKMFQRRLGMFCRVMVYVIKAYSDQNIIYQIMTQTFINILTLKW